MKTAYPFFRVPDLLAYLISQLNREPRTRITSTYGKVREDSELAYKPKSIATAQAAYDQTLHKVFDQWIDSGKSKTNLCVDTPQDRTLENVPSSYTEPLFDIVNEWLGRNKPSVTLSGNGELTAHFPVVDPRTLNESPLAFGRDLAIGEFMKLLELPFRARLARCANDACRKYFAHDRTPNRTIKNGSFCSSCKGKGSSVRTETSRKQVAKHITSLAADVWPKWKQSSRYKNRSVWIANEVNKHLGQRHKPITGKWVTQNEPSIQAEIERRNHAQS